jgi:hypothetical protein
VEGTRRLGTTPTVCDQKKTARWGDVHKAVHYQRRILPGGRLREERVADLPDKDHKIAYKFIIEQSSVQARRSGKGP